MSYTMLGNRATSPDTGFASGDDASGEVSPHGNGGSHVRPAMPGVDDVSATAHADLVNKVNHLRETLDQTQSAPEAVQTRL